jgi:predicted NAD/FAD-dependent oxidoreductase
MHRTDVVVIGAGMAGLTLANTLTNAGVDVLCVEKARGTGGRLSSKRWLTEDYGSLSFDLGASAFTVSTQAFKSFLDVLNSGTASEVDDHFQQQVLEEAVNGAVVYVPASRSSSITRTLANGVRLECGVKISHMEFKNGSWLTFVEDESGRPVQFSESSFLVLAVPPEQAYTLLPVNHPYKQDLASAKTHPQWVSVFYVSHSVLNALGWRLTPALYELSSAEIKRISVESLKADRTSPADGRGQLIKVEAQPQWSAERTNWNKDAIADALWSALCEQMPVTEGGAHPISDPQPLTQYTHRWLYSLPQPNALSYAGRSQNRMHLDLQQNLAVCGDYLAIHSSIEGVEAAYLSGSSLAASLLQTFRQTFSTQQEESE